MQYKLLLVITMISILLTSCSDSTEPQNKEISIINEILFHNTAGHEMIKTYDNSIVLGVSGDDPGLLKLDINGNKIWERFYSTAGYGAIIDNLTETLDKGFLFCGTGAYGTGGFISKTDSTGNVIWTKDSLDLRSFWKVLENNQEEIIFITHSGSYITVQKFDKNGNYIWGNNFKYNLNNIDLPVWRIYDFNISPTNDIYIIYSSYTSKLVKIKITNEGDYDYGDYYDINCKDGCIFFKGLTQYIFGRYDAFDEDYLTYLYTFYNYDQSSAYYCKSYEQIDDFYGYNSSTLTNDGGLLATDDCNIVKLDNKFDFEWRYKIDWTTTDDRFKSTIEIEDNLYALLGNTEWEENDSTVHGSFLRFFQKN